MYGSGSKLKFLAIILSIFIFGWFANNAYSFLTDISKERPFSISSNEIKSPGDWIQENQVKIRDKAVTLVIKNATWAMFTDTNSMDPVIDAESHAIKIMPQKASELSIGDIISYRSSSINGIIIHRIIDKRDDEQGIYFITKGDNNRYSDPEKVRFSQITGVVVGILY
ncbi:signal peptidase I [Candidatus Woesearchaeota archaeon]|nr:signal peptidase I [Candidatus Woesearchaeota archaeon]